MSCEKLRKGHGLEIEVHKVDRSVDAHGQHGRRSSQSRIAYPFYDGGFILEIPSPLPLSFLYLRFFPLPPSSSLSPSSLRLSLFSLLSSSSSILPPLSSSLLLSPSSSLSLLSSLLLFPLSFSPLHSSGAIQTMRLGGDVAAEIKQFRPTEKESERKRATHRHTLSHTLSVVLFCLFWELGRAWP